MSQMFQDVTQGDKRDKLVLLRLTKNEKALLKRIAHKRGVRMQTLIRNAIGKELEGETSPTPK